MKILSPTAHGILDYGVILLLFILPGLLNFPQNAALASYIIGAGYLVMVLVTAYPLGLIKALPFTVHGGVELVLAPIFILMPWLAGFSSHAPALWFFIIAGVALFFVYLTTDYPAADRAYGKRGAGFGGTRGSRGAPA